MFPTMQLATQLKKSDEKYSQKFDYATIYDNNVSH